MVIDRRRRLALAAPVAILLAGCRAALGIDEDRATLDTAAASEVDASVGEGGLPIAPDRFCSTLSPQPMRCWDFEEGNLLGGWDYAATVPYPGTVGGGTFDELLAPGGRKVLAHTPLLGENQNAAALLEFMIPSLPPRILLSAELNVIEEDLLTEGKLVVISVVFGDEGAVTVYRDKEGAAMAVVPGGKAIRFPLWRPGAPHTIGVDIVTGENGGASASLDGVWGPSLPLPAHFATAPTSRILLGPSGVPPVGGATVSIDDVTLYWGAARQP